jgi:para-nitrobenzyl esterase
VLRMFSDFRFVTPTVLTARAAAQTTDVYMYRFSRVSPVNQATWGGAGHGVEIPYVFNHITPDASQYEEIDRTLSRTVAGAWVQFAKTGNPNGPGLPPWPPYRAPDYRLLEYGNEIGVQSNAVSSTIDFFRQVFESLRRKPTGPRR